MAVRDCYPKIEDIAYGSCAATLYSQVEVIASLVVSPVLLEGECIVDQLCTLDMAVQTGKHEGSDPCVTPVGHGTVTEQ